jgi:hypothetical protein
MIAVFNAVEAFRAHIREPSSRIFPFVPAPHAPKAINQSVFLSREFVGIVGRHREHEFGRLSFRDLPPNQRP